MLAQIPTMVLLVISIAANWFNSIFNNQYCKKNAANDADVSLFLMSRQLTTLAVLILMTTDIRLSWYTVMMAVGFGIATIATVWSTCKALQYGPMGLFKVLLSSSMVIPALSGAVFWREKLTVPIICGVIGTVITIIIITKPKKSEKTVSGKFVVYCLIAVLANSTVCIMQKVHQTAHKDEIDGFLLIAFAIAALMTVTFFLKDRKNMPLNVPFTPKRAPFWLSIGAGVCSALPNRINLHLTGVMDSAIFFPLFNGGVLLLSVLAAILLFRERPTILQYGGIAVGIISVLLLSSIV